MSIGAESLLNLEDFSDALVTVGDPGIMDVWKARVEYLSEFETHTHTHTHTRTIVGDEAIQLSLGYNVDHNKTVR